MANKVVCNSFYLSFYVSADRNLGAGDWREKICHQDRASPLLEAISLGISKQERERWVVSGPLKAANISKTLSRSVTSRLELNITSTRAVKKM